MSAGALRRLDESGWPLLLARLVLGGSFVWLGALKAADPAAFLVAVRQFGVVSDTHALSLNLLAATLPWVEIWCGLLLLLGIGVRGAALTLLLMLVVFTLAIFQRATQIQAAEGLRFCEVAFDCGCGTGIVPVCSKLAQNVGLLLMAALGCGSRSERYCLRARLIGSQAAAAPRPRGD
ncbi:MAG: MauE/DoxX family redox-associated membrane protein [Planctomycetota bacterium]